jgi:transcription-repair coupling factor (superfamily II helicase)
VDLGIPALLPDDYIPDVHTRLIIYKRIASATDESALERLQIELIDRFGLLPPQTKNLFAITHLKLLASPLGIQKMDAGETSGRILFTPQPEIDVNALLTLIQKESESYQLEGQEKLRFRMSEMPVEKRIQWLENLLKKLGPAHASAKT